MALEPFAEVALEARGVDLVFLAIVDFVALVPVVLDAGFLTDVGFFVEARFVADLRVAVPVALELDFLVVA